MHRINKYLGQWSVNVLQQKLLSCEKLLRYQ